MNTSLLINKKRAINIMMIKHKGLRVDNWLLTSDLSAVGVIHYLKSDQSSYEKLAKVN